VRYRTKEEFLEILWENYSIGKRYSVREANRLYFHEFISFNILLTYLDSFTESKYIRIVCLYFRVKRCSKSFMFTSQINAYCRCGDHSHLVPRLRMSRSYTCSPPSAFISCSMAALALACRCGSQIGHFGGINCSQTELFSHTNIVVIACCRWGQ
jgi:hypothetical protein